MQNTFCIAQPQNAILLLGLRSWTEIASCSNALPSDDIFKLAYQIIQTICDGFAVPENLISGIGFALGLCFK